MNSNTFQLSLVSSIIVLLVLGGAAFTTLNHSSASDNNTIPYECDIEGMSVWIIDAKTREHMPLEELKHKVILMGWTGN